MPVVDNSILERIRTMTNQFAENLLAENDGKFPSYAWPGGYPIFYLAADNGVLCAECANTEPCVKNASDEYPDDNQWRIVASDINWEDASLYCDNCSKRIESAYAEV